VQLSVPMAENVPAGQGVHAEANGEEKEPAGQGEQEVESGEDHVPPTHMPQDCHTCPVEDVA